MPLPRRWLGKISDMINQARGARLITTPVRTSSIASKRAGPPRSENKKRLTRANPRAMALVPVSKSGLLPKRSTAHNPAAVQSSFQEVTTIDCRIASEATVSKPARRKAIGAWRNRGPVPLNCCRTASPHAMRRAFLIPDRKRSAKLPVFRTGKWAIRPISRSAWCDPPIRVKISRASVFRFLWARRWKSVPHPSRPESERWKRPASFSEGPSRWRRFRAGSRTDRGVVPVYSVHLGNIELAPIPGRCSRKAPYWNSDSAKYGSP